MGDLVRLERVEGRVAMTLERPWIKSERRKLRVRPNGYRRALKRKAARLMRHLSKALLGDAPQKLAYRGYEW